MTLLSEIASSFQGLALAGRGAGVRWGDWCVSLVESGDIQDDGWLGLDDLRQVELVRSRRTVRHLLQPYDILVTARAGSVGLAMVPPEVADTVAGVTTLVVRAHSPETGMGHYLWYYLTSTFGRRELVKRLTVNATITSLSSRAISEVPVPLPSPHQVGRLASLVEASEEAYTAAVRVATLRRETVRDSVIREILSGAF